MLDASFTAELGDTSKSRASRYAGYEARSAGDALDLHPGFHDSFVEAIPPPGDLGGGGHAGTQREAMNVELQDDSSAATPPVGSPGGSDPAGNELEALRQAWLEYSEKLAKGRLATIEGRPGDANIGEIFIGEREAGDADAFAM